MTFAHHTRQGGVVTSRNEGQSVIRINGNSLWLYGRNEPLNQ
jgi:hypothetical protein